MEGVEMEMEEVEGISFSAAEEHGDLGSSVLARFQNSPREDHQHLCTVVGAMSQEIKDHGITLTPVAYFGAAASTLDRLSQDPSSGVDPATAAMLTFLSIVLPRVSPVILRKRTGSVSETLGRILGFGTVSEGAIKAGLKCVSHLLVVGDKGSWSSIGSLYGVLLGFVTDDRPKVRKQSHSCLRDVVQSFQGSSVLALASEGITTIFERSILLAGGSNSASNVAAVGPIGALEILKILNVLRDCLPLMSIKFTTNNLKYCKSLLDLRKPIVTRHVMEILQAFCYSSTSEVAPEVLLDLLCSLASSASDKENSADVIASTARLLHVGTKKVYDLNRQICVVKLPTIFSALGDILAFEHEEVIFAATEALKGLICTCIDESLVKQGVDQINLNSEGARRSGPTIIEKICATIEGFLGYQYGAVWDISFQILSAMFDKLGGSTSYMMAGTMNILADMQKLSDEDLVFRKQLHECVGSALGALGPEMFLGLLPLNLDAEDLSEANVWLLPILKQYTVGARLGFFTRSILSMAGLIQQKSQKLEQEGLVVTARNRKALVYSLWSLLPAFCNYPLDTANSFKSLQEVLCNTLRKEPDLHGIICSSLQILIQQNKKILAEDIGAINDDISGPERKAKDHYTARLAEDNLNAIRLCSPQLLSVLFEIFLTDSKDNGGCLQTTIREIASISDKKLVKNFFRNTMQKLLNVTREITRTDQPNSMQIDSTSGESSLTLRRALLLDLAVSLLPGLNMDGIDLLYNAIKPVFQDKLGLIQKKAYKILSIILKECDEFISRKLDDLLELMIEALPSCHFSAKRHRLDSLYYLIVYVSKDSSEQRKREIISSFLTEIILALKEANKKTRNRAYDLLVKIGHACGDEDQGGKKENLQQFFNMVAGGLAGETPHMISAAVKGLARLAYEFSDLISATYNLLPSAFLLLQRKNREIIKANLGLLKVLVAKSQADGLHMHLRNMVEGLLKWQNGTKNHFKAKVKFLLEMLVRKCGLDAVKSVMPEEHMKLLTNIRKTKERKERKAKSEEEPGSLHSKTNASRLSKWNHTHIFSDFGDEDCEDGSDAEHMESTFSGRQSKLKSKASSARSMQLRKSSKSLPEDLFDQMEDDPLDLLDRQKTRSALHSCVSVKRKNESDDELEIDPDGRLVIREDDTKLRKEKSLSSNDNLDTRSHTGSRSTAVSLKSTQSKRRKTTDSGWAYTGSEYTSKKAGGDVKRKNKLEPYAYWPLDRKLLNRRAEHKATARKGMATVMKVTKKLEGKSASGALSVKGVKLKHKRTQRKAHKRSR